MAEEMTIFDLAKEVVRLEECVKFLAQNVEQRLQEIIANQRDFFVKVNHVCEEAAVLSNRATDCERRIGLLEVASLGRATHEDRIGKLEASMKWIALSVWGLASCGTIAVIYTIVEHITKR